jgi:hypothetical protein
MGKPSDLQHVGDDKKPTRNLIRKFREVITKEKNPQKAEDENLREASDSDFLQRVLDRKKKKTISQQKRRLNRKEEADNDVIGKQKETDMLKRDAERKRISRAAIKAAAKTDDEIAQKTYNDTKEKDAERHKKLRKEIKDKLAANDEEEKRKEVDRKRKHYESKKRRFDKRKEAAVLVILSDYVSQNHENSANTVKHCQG